MALVTDLHTGTATHGGAYSRCSRLKSPEISSESSNRDNEIVAWLGTDTDIDDLKRADDERIELLVRERAARFEAEAAQKRAADLYVEAREAVKIRDEFLTVAAHELRTPLTTLRLQAQQFARGAKTSPPRGRCCGRWSGSASWSISSSTSRASPPGTSSCSSRPETCARWSRRRQGV